MSFADDLRKYDRQKEAQKKADYDAQNQAKELISAIMSACSTASHNGNRCISGYVRKYMDDGYAETEFVNSLPTVKSYEELSRKFNKERHYYTGGRDLVSPGKGEIRLYKGYIIAQDNVNFIKLVRDKLAVEIRKLGFTKFSVKIQKLQDIYVVISRTAGFFSQKVTETVSERVSQHVLYTIKIDIEW